MPCVVGIAVAVAELQQPDVTRPRAAGTCSDASERSARCRRDCECSCRTRTAFRARDSRRASWKTDRPADRSPGRPISIPRDFCDLARSFARSHRNMKAISSAVWAPRKRWQLTWMLINCTSSRERISTTSPKRRIRFSKSVQSLKFFFRWKISAACSSVSRVRSAVPKALAAIAETAFSTSARSFSSMQTPPT